MAILFISSLVPEEKEFYTPAFSRSGQNVLKGIADKMVANDENLDLVTCLPVQSFPKGPLIIKRRKLKYENGRNIICLPTLNLLFIKNIIWGISAFFYILKWAKIHQAEDRNILVYNIYLPIISTLYKAARRTNSKIYAILYDLGVPPKHLKLGMLKTLGYRYYERLAYKYIPLIDGRIVINEKIINEYAPGKDYILVDGGVNNDLINRLFPLYPSRSNTVTYVLAGMLWEQNGTRLILEALKLCPELDIKVIFAGKGNDVKVIDEAASVDKRVSYVGMLTPDELFEVYKTADVLLNLRIEEDNDMHFPSKLLEYMSLGKCVLSTPIAHAERDYGEYLDFLQDLTPQGLADKMREISLRSKLDLFDRGQKMREFILRTRTWDVRTLEILEYIKQQGTNDLE